MPVMGTPVRESAITRVHVRLPKPPVFGITVPVMVGAALSGKKLNREYPAIPMELLLLAVPYAHVAVAPVPVRVTLAKSEGLLPIPTEYRLALAGRAGHP